MNGSWTSHLTVRTLYLLFLGQLASFALALSSFTSSLIADLGVDAPLTQMLLVYLGLALVYGGVMLYRRRRLLVPWYWYLILGCVDVQGNYLVNKAYQYSSITSVTLLDCWTIVWVVALTWIFLGTRYSLWQLLGAALSVLGLGFVMLSDAGVGGGGTTDIAAISFLVVQNRYWEMFLSLLGQFFFAVSNVAEEFCVKKKDRVEVLAMLGLFGTLVSVIEISIVERESDESIQWSTDIILAFVGFAASCFMFYSLVPFVLKMSGATMFNLSALTSDMWAVVVRIFVYRQEVDWLYYLAFSVVIIGVVIYSVTEKDPDGASAMEEGNPTRYQVLSDESAVVRDEEPSRF